MDRDEPEAARGGPAPRVWLLISDKLGDNAQALAIADSLGWPYEVRRVYPRPEWVLGKPRFRPGLGHLDPARSDPLEPPWPDIVITIGRRSAMAALWVRERSSGRSKVVLINRPKKSSLDDFSLVIVPSQFRVPPHPKVVNLDLPLMRADREAVARAAADWGPRLRDLPRPLTAVFVGGRTKPYVFDREIAERLARKLGRLRAAEGGTLYVTTSRRTQPEIVRALKERLPPDARLYDWTAEKGADNPYLGLLGLADRFVVTGDSMSMMVEVASLGRPLAIFPLPLGASPVGRLVAAAGRVAGPDLPGGGLLARLAHVGHQLGLVGYARDLSAVHRLLYAKGLAARLGDPFPPPGPGLADELEPVAARIRALAA